MAIKIPAVTIDGINEQVLAHSVTELGADLLTRALAQLLAPMQATAMGDARLLYSSIASDKEDERRALLPVFVQQGYDEDFLVWYFEQPEAVNAKDREAALRLEVIEPRISEIEDRIVELDEHIAARADSADENETEEVLAAAVEPLTTEKAGLEVELAALQAELATLK